MKFLKYGMAIAIFAVIALSVAGCSKEPLAATVNGKKITVAEVDDRLQQLTQQYGDIFQGDQNKQLKDDFRKRIIDELVEMELILQYADKQGIKVTDKDVDSKIKELMKQYDIKDQKALEEILKQQNVTFAEFKDEVIIRGMKIEGVIEKVTKGVEVSDKDIEAYYNKNKSEFVTKDQVLASHILVQKEDDAKRILEEIKGGADFAKLAKENSIDPGSKDNGGAMPWTPKEKFVEPFREACWSLNPGGLSDIVKTDYGYHVIKLIDKKPAAQQELAEVKDEIKNLLLKDKKQEALTKWLEEQKKKADIKKYPIKDKDASSSGAASGTAPGGAPAEKGPTQTNPQPNLQPGK